MIMSRSVAVQTTSENCSFSLHRLSRREGTLLKMVSKHEFILVWPTCSRASPHNLLVLQERGTRGVSQRSCEESSLPGSSIRRPDDSFKNCPQGPGRPGAAGNEGATNGAFWASRRTLLLGIRSILGIPTTLCRTEPSGCKAFRRLTVGEGGVDGILSWCPANHS